MAKLKPRPTSAPSRAASANGLTLDVLLDGPRPGRENPDADRQWLAGQRTIDRLTAGTEWDVRHVLTLTEAECRRWDAQRRAWLAERVACAE